MQPLALSLLVSATLSAGDMQSVESVLAHHRDRGQNIIWSSLLLNVQQQVPTGATRSRSAFAHALAPQGLDVRLASNGQSWVIVPLQADKKKQMVPTSQRAPVLMDEIIVRSSRFSLRERQPRLEQRSLFAEQLSALPKLGDDVLRPVLRLPGVSSVGVSAQPHVRGGFRDEMLVLFNGIEIIEPFHLKNFQSLFSGINPSLVDKVDVYTGSFPSRFGNRLSAVMDIGRVDAADGDKGVLGLSLLNAWGSAMNTFADGNGSWAVSARRGNLDLFIDEINENVGKPSYADYYAQMSYGFERGEFDAGLLYYNGDIELEDRSKGQLTTSRYHNLYAWTKWSMALSEQSSSNTQLSVARIARSRYGDTIAPSEFGEDGFFDEDINIRQLRLDQTFEYAPSETLSMSAGVGVHYSQARYYVDQQLFFEPELRRILFGLEEDEFFADDLEAQLEPLLTEPKGLSAYSYLSARLQLNPNLSFDAGLRADFQNYGNLDREYQLSPRIGMVFVPAAEHQLRFSVGRYAQAELIGELAVADRVVDFEPAQKADQLVIAYEYRPDTELALRVEAYQRRVKNPKFRYENLFNPFVLVPELAADRVPIYSERAKIHGVELSAEYQASGEVWLWANYSKVLARDYTIMWEKRSWNQRDSFNAGLVWSRQNYQLSATVSWHSGWLTTRLPEVIDFGDVAAYERNDAELPDFFSLDLKLSRFWRSKRHDLELFLEISNTTNRRNVGSVEHQLTNLEDGRIGIFPVHERLLPIIPVLGVVWRLH